MSQTATYNGAMARWASGGGREGSAPGRAGGAGGTSGSSANVDSVGTAERSRMCVAPASLPLTLPVVTDGDAVTRIDDEVLGSTLSSYEGGRLPSGLSLCMMLQRRVVSWRFGRWCPFDTVNLWCASEGEGTCGGVERNHHSRIVCGGGAARVHFDKNACVSVGPRFSAVCRIVSGRSHDVLVAWWRTGLAGVSPRGTWNAKLGSARLRAPT